MIPRPQIVPPLGMSSVKATTWSEWSRVFATQFEPPINRHSLMVLKDNKSVRVRPHAAPHS